MDELMTQIKQYSRETLEQKFYNLVKLNTNTFDIKSYDKVRRLQYLNKNYTKSVSTYNNLIREYKETNDRFLGVFLQEHYERLEKIAQEQQDFPLWEK